MQCQATVTSVICPCYFIIDHFAFGGLKTFYKGIINNIYESLLVEILSHWRCKKKGIFKQFRLPSWCKLWVSKIFIKIAICTTNPSLNGNDYYNNSVSRSGFLDFWYISMMAGENFLIWERTPPLFFILYPLINFTIIQQWLEFYHPREDLQVSMAVHLHKYYSQYKTPILNLINMYFSVPRHKFDFIKCYSLIPDR